MRVTCLLIAASAAAFAGLADHITEYDMDNGLHVIIYSDSSAPVVSTNVFYRVGAYDETPGSTGLSHMLEHMTFKHSDRYEPGTFHSIVKENGGYNNGFTSTYYTGYYEDFASDRWELALELEAARMGSCRFEEDEFASEHQVVTEEWRLGYNRPFSALWREFMGAAYRVHPHRNPIIGWEDDITNFTAAKAKAWYREHYNPANAMLVVAGDVRPDEARKLISKHFGRLEGRPAQRADYYSIEPEQEAERRVVVRKKNAMDPYMMIGWHNSGVRDDDAYAGDVLAGILGRGRTSRLFRRLVTDEGIAVTVSASNYFHDPGLLRVFINPRSEEDIPEIERIVEEELQKLRTEPVSDSEIQRVHNRVLADAVFERDDISDLAYYLSVYHIAEGDWRIYEQYPERIRAVSKDDVMAFCRKYLGPGNRTVGILLPEKED